MQTAASRRIASSPTTEATISSALRRPRAILADGIYSSVNGVIAHIKDQGCPYALHATSLEIVRRLAKIDVERFGKEDCPGQLKMLETIESLRDDVRRLSGCCALRLCRLASIRLVRSEQRPADAGGIDQ